VKRRRRMTARRNLKLAGGCYIIQNSRLFFCFFFSPGRLSVVSGYLPARIIGFDEAVRQIRM
jgi:hypothetical protein